MDSDDRANRFVLLFNNISDYINKSGNFKDTDSFSWRVDTVSRHDKALAAYRETS